MAGTDCLGILVKVILEAYVYRQYGALEGTVVFVSPDSQVADDKLDDNTALPRYTARITFTNHEVGHGVLQGQVKLGMTGKVEIITNNENLLSVLLRKIRRTISFT